MADKDYKGRLPPDLCQKSLMEGFIHRPFHILFGQGLRGSGTCINIPAALHYSETRKVEFKDIAQNNLM